MKNDMNPGEMLDLIVFCDAVFGHTGYHELKHDRKQLMEIYIKDFGRLSEPWSDMLLKTLRNIDDRLAEFSAEEKAIYDAVYGGETA